jgi:hypothetical protein
MAEESISCVEPVVQPTALDEATPTTLPEEAKMAVARAGAKAPDFSGMAYYEGGFEKVSLSDYAGKWTVLCFYPGDFTFV